LTSLARLPDLLHQPHGSSTNKRGGSVAIIHRDDINVRQLDVATPMEFEVGGDASDLQ